ncbi:MAG: hypothetical protein PVH88_04250 [Ignavibacteria bacterium]|jgi:hypothetical protein
MGAFLGISLWVALATVVPGFITIALLYCAFAINDTSILDPLKNTFEIPSDWIIGGIAVTIMVLTQTFGILLEKVIITFKLFPFCTKLKVPKEFSHKGEEEINAYDQYNKLYILLAQLSEHEDSQGHLKRVIAQFFLTNNTLVSFITGMTVSLILAYGNNYQAVYLYYYTAGLFICLAVTYYVAVIRFRVMAKSIWATQSAREMKT